MINRIEELFIESTNISKKIIETAYQNSNLKEKLYYIWIISLLISINEYCDIENLLSIYKKYYKRNAEENILRKYIITNYIKNEKIEDFRFVDEITKNYQVKINKIISDILLSIFHMNHNRVFGINRKHENELMSNVENIYYSLMRIMTERDDKG